MESGMEAENQPEDQDVYHLPKHLRKVGKIFLKAASDEKRSINEVSTGGTIIEDFYHEFGSALRQVSRNFLKLLKAHAKISEELGGSPSDLLRAIGRVDGVVDEFIETYKLVMSYELEDNNLQETQRHGLEMLRSTVESMIRSEIKYKKKLGKKILDAEDFINKNTNVLDGNKYTIALDFDHTALNKLRGTVLWFKRYREYYSGKSESLRQFEVFRNTSDSIDPEDAAIMGYIVGANHG